MYTYHVSESKRTSLVSVLMGLIVTVLAVSPCVATEGSLLNWNYQLTGFKGYPNSNGMQTAVALRDGQVWPVIFAENNNRYLQAYSLYPVQNPTTQLNWHQIGTNLLQDPGPAALSAVTSSDGRVGAFLNIPSTSPMSSAVVGGPSPNGFGGAMTGVQAIAFDSQGNLIQGTQTTVPPIQGAPTVGPVVDIAVSPAGDLGVLDSQMKYYQKMSMTGSWGYVNLAQAVTPPITSLQYTDLAIDSLGRPHVTGIQGNSLVALDFNITSGRWVSQVLGSSLEPILGATLAADDQGRVAAAWVETTATGANLKYACKDGLDSWMTQTVTSTAGPYPPIFQQTETLYSRQRVGLAFDANDLPLISFVGQSGNIWLAYDPVPEPSILALLISGVAFSLVAAGRMHRSGKR
jgi:hypothetical protein